MSDIDELVRRRVFYQATVRIVAIASTSGTAAAQQQAVSSAKYLGVAAAAMLILLGLAYFFIKYGGDYVTPTGEEH